MNQSTQSSSIGPVADGAAIATISMPNPESETRLRALLAERGPTLRIRLEAPADADVMGHQLNAAPVTLHVVDEDDTEGHAMNLHFPTPHDAKQFEQRMLATGAIVGTLVIAGGGGLALTQAFPATDTGPSTQAQVETSVSQAGTPAQPSRADGLTGKQEALLAEMTGVDAVETDASPAPINPATGNAFSGKEQALLDKIAGTDPNDK